MHVTWYHAPPASSMILAHKEIFCKDFMQAFFLSFQMLKYLLLLLNKNFKYLQYSTDWPLSTVGAKLICAPESSLKQVLLSGINLGSKVNCCLC